MTRTLYQSYVRPFLPDVTKYESAWHEPWSEPVRVKRLHVSQFPVVAFTPLTPLNKVEATWHYPWSEPVRLKLGLLPGLQQFFAANIEPTKGPVTNVTIFATETNTDMASFGIFVYGSTTPVFVQVAGANVSIREVPAIDGGAASIEER
jgi:hypothetical protein